jgi:signal transduction histidine kinase
VSFKTVNGQVAIRVVDNGEGIDTSRFKQRPSLGILGMQERSRLIGAKLDIRPAHGGGTAVELKVSKPAEAAERAQ